MNWFSGRDHCHSGRSGADFLQPSRPVIQLSAESADLQKNHAARNWIALSGPTVRTYSSRALDMPRSFCLSVFLLSDGGGSAANLRVAGRQDRWVSLLVLMVPALLTLWHTPEVRGAIPSGGLLGHWFPRAARRIQYGGSESGRARDFFRRLFLTTRFSFIETHDWLRGPLSKLNVIGPLRERYLSWREDREQERRRKRLERIKMEGRLRFPSYGMAKERRTPSPRRRESRTENERSRRHRVSRSDEGNPPRSHRLHRALQRGAANFRLPFPTCFVWPSVAPRSKRMS